MQVIEPGIKHPGGRDHHRRHHGAVAGAPGVGKTVSWCTRIWHGAAVGGAPRRSSGRRVSPSRRSLVLLARRFAVPVQTDARSALLSPSCQRAPFREEAQQGRSVVLLIDEAQALPLETLEQLPLLVPLTASPGALLQMVLVSTARTTSTACGVADSVTSRGAVSSVRRIRPLTQAETLAYIGQRMARVALPRKNQVWPKGPPGHWALRTRGAART